MSRESVRSTRILFFVILSLLLFTACQNNTDQYNVLFIVADDMNGYGFNKTNPQVLSPNLDKFKETALSFPNTYCPAPACSPSRTAFLSGVSPHRSGKYYNGGTAWDKSLLMEQENMMEWFQRAGYNTYGKGKLFHSKIDKKRVEDNFMGTTGRAGFGPFPDSLHRVIPGNRFRGMQAFPDQDFPDVVNADQIIELLQTDQEKPFFMMYGLWRPHSPYTCPQRFYDMYNVDEIEIPDGFYKNDTADLPELAKAFIDTKRDDFQKITSTEKQWKEYLRGYFACYSFADYNIGRVLNALKESKYADNTIVVITSDNGFHMGEKNRFDKNSLWELSAVTPMAIYLPGSKHSGGTCTKPVNLQDLFPTFVDLCGNGMKPLKTIDGKSIKPLLDNPNAEWEKPSITYFGKGWISIRSENFRYLFYPDGSEELYDHRTDIWELKNIAGDSNFNEIKSHLKSFVPAEMAESIPGRWTDMIKRLEEKVSAKE